MAGRPIFAFISLILLAGAIVLQLFVILGGAVSGTPEDLVWFISTDNPNGRIPNAPISIAWTFFAICQISNGKTHNCASPKAALPFSPDRNFGTHKGVPAEFFGDKFYLLSRFMFAFYLIALFFAVVALFSALLALCSRIGGILSSIGTFAAFFFQVIGAALMTACFVEGEDLLNSHGFKANIGKYAFGFSWASTAAFLICVVLLCLSARSGKDGSHGGGGRFGRSKSTRSRDGVKSDYS